jgi:hypothetical protein
LLALLAEAGHLLVGFNVWPAAPAAGLYHVAVAAALGLLAVAVYCGHTSRELVAGVVLGVAVPAAWLVGAAMGMAPYPWAPAIGLTVLELVLAGLLLIAPRSFA